MKLILSLDGGGVRGIFEVRILQYIEQKMNKKIFDIFDMVVGVSIGSIIGALIVCELFDDVESFESMSNQLFTDKHILGPYIKTMYTGRKKTELLSRIFSNIRMCDISKQFVVLTSSISGVPTIFKTSDTNHSNLLVKDVLDASSAVPILFPPKKIQNKFYMDGGIVSNDPVLCGIMEARQIWKDEKFKIFSIGVSNHTTQLNDDCELSNFGLVQWLNNGLLEIMANSNSLLYGFIIRNLVGKHNYMKVSCDLNLKIDDISDQSKCELYKHAHDVFYKFANLIIPWLQNDLSELQHSVLKYQLTQQ